MFTRPFIKKTEQYSRLAHFQQGSNNTAINYVVNPSRVGIDSNDVSYSAGVFTFLKSGRFLFTYEGYNYITWQNVNNQSGSAVWGWQLNNSAYLVSLAATFTGASSSLTNGFSTKQYLNRGTPTALSGAAPAGGGNTITTNCDMFYSAEIEFLSGDYIHARHQCMAFANTAPLFSMDGYVKIERLT